MDLDKRLFAYRDDIANIELKGKVTSKEFLEGEKYQVATGISRLFANTRRDYSLG